MLVKHIILLAAVRAALAGSSNDGNGWQSISVGLMVQRSVNTSCPHDGHLMKRSLRQSRRDYKQTVEQISRSTTGALHLPGDLGILGMHGVRMPGVLRRDMSSFDSIITWYTGGDLLDPSCLPNGGWNPTDDSMIAAVTLNWPDKPPCGAFLKLRPKDGDGDKSGIIVRIMDACAGCQAGTAHVDLTKAAFRQLYDLDVGLVRDIEVKVLDSPPFDVWGKGETMLYGPMDLKGDSDDWQKEAKKEVKKQAKKGKEALEKKKDKKKDKAKQDGDGEGGEKNDESLDWDEVEDYWPGEA